MAYIETQFNPSLASDEHDDAMRSVLLLLVAGIFSGFLAVAIAVAMGFGFLAVVGFYSLGGMIGLLLTATLVATTRSRPRVPTRED